MEVATGVKSRDESIPVRIFAAALPVLEIIALSLRLSDVNNPGDKRKWILTGRRLGQVT